MIYFKTYYPKESDSQKFENAIRVNCIRRHHTLDLLTSVSEAGEKKLFYGVERKDGIQITRIKSPLTRYLPKIIIRFCFGEKVTYNARLDIWSTLVFLFLSIALTGSFYSIVEKEWTGFLLTLSPLGI